MSDGIPNIEEIERFIADEIDSVPQLEALLLIWNNRRGLVLEEMAKALYVSPDAARDILKYLTQRTLIEEVEGGKGRYAVLADSEEKVRLLACLDEIYRRELMRISNMIHAKASRAVRDFASAFRFKKIEARGKGDLHLVHDRMSALRDHAIAGIFPG